jgi:hypothetical protein
VAAAVWWHMPVEAECVLLVLSVSTFSISIISCTALVQVLRKNCVKFWFICCVMIHMNEVTAFSRHFTQRVEVVSVAPWFVFIKFAKFTLKMRK